jgi:hypothetical protein
MLDTKLPPYVFATEDLTRMLLHQMIPLLMEHYLEVAHFRDIPFDPDYDLFLNAQAAGSVRTYTVRSEGKLVGYSVFFVRQNPHYKQSKQALQDVIYLDPSMRGGTGAKFIMYCEEQLKAEGVEVVYHHIKAKFEHHKDLYAKLGYEVIDYVVGKRVN